MTKSRALLLAENEIIETERCILRTLTLADSQDMFEYCSNPNVAKYTTFEPHQTLRESEEAIANFFIPDQLTKWAIELKKNNKMIGTIDMMAMTADSTEFGWAISEDYWGQGIVAEVARPLVKLAFEELGLIKIEAKHHVDNPNSGRVMAKIGMRYWGKNYISPEKYQTKSLEVAYYGMTKDDYDKLSMK